MRLWKLRRTKIDLDSDYRIAFSKQLGTRIVWRLLRVRLAARHSDKERERCLRTNFLFVLTEAYLEHADSHLFRSDQATAEDTLLD
jgi:hypothetical protein